MLLVGGRCVLGNGFVDVAARDHVDVGSTLGTVTSRPAAAFVVMLWIGILSGGQRCGAQTPERSGPPVPYEDVGACPFEGCVYRDWVANDAITIRRERRAGATAVFRLKKGEQVTAITGVVVTITPGRVQFREPVDLFSRSGSLHVEPGQTLYLLTYRGEGSTVAWFEGRVYEDVDGSTAFFNGLCTDDSSRCVGTVLEQPQSVWWVQIKNARGQIGWTDETNKFGNKDALGDDHTDVREIIATIGRPTNGACPISWTHQRMLIAGGRCVNSGMSASDITIQMSGP